MQKYRIPLIRPHMNQRVKTMVNDVLDSGCLTEGQVTKQFEKAISDYTGAKHAIAFNSCTTGLQTALHALGIGKGDEVIVPDFTYPATALAVQNTGATPVIIDIDPDTMLIDFEKAEKAITSETRAIIPVSLFGNPLNHDRLKELRKQYNLLIIEDAACALGSRFKNRPTGSISDVTAFSFHPRKFITTGEGGIVTTNNKEWAEAMERYKHFGTGYRPDREEMAFMEPGTNFKLSNILAAAGLAQMEIIDDLLEERQSLANRYNKLLQDTNNVKIPEITAHGQHSYQSYVVFVSNRNEIIKTMRDQGIEVQIGTFSLHLHPAFQNPNTKLKGPFPGSLKAYNEALTLPLYHDMSKTEQLEVVEKLKRCVE